MKTYIASFITKTAVLAPALIICLMANAQRERGAAGGRNGGGGGQRQSTMQRPVAQPRPTMQSQPRQQSTAMPRQQGSVPRPINNTPRPREATIPRAQVNNTPRPAVRPAPQPTNTPRATSRPTVANGTRPVRNNTTIINNNTTVVRPANGRPNNGRPNNGSVASRPYNNRPYVAPPRFGYNRPAWGYRYPRLSSPYRPYYWGGYNYWFSNGYFYRPYGSYVELVMAPRGLRVSVLPFGYCNVWDVPNMYYYYGGTYYRQYDNSSYEVVDPPLGAKLPALPDDAKLVTINDQDFYESDGTYYMETANVKGQRLYEVVGVHGKLNTDQVALVNSANPAPASSDIVDVLPANCKNVTINGQQYFVSPDNVYFQSITDGKTVSYQVVGGDTTTTVQ